VASIFQEVDKTTGYRRVAQIFRTTSDKLESLAGLLDEVAYQYFLNGHVRSAVDALDTPSEPSADAYQRARDAICRADIESNLKAVLCVR
jgi:hypothetical protein